MTEECGGDNEGRKYASLEEMWAFELKSDDQAAAVEVDGIQKWYNKGAGYWSEIEQTDNGMLGGFGALSDLDVRDSWRFLSRFTNATPLPAGVKRHEIQVPLTYACDCGAGIGRVTRDFLLQHFQFVDIVEQNPAFVAKAMETLPADRVKESFACGLQDFTPPPQRYNVIWIQWVAAYLTDVDFVAFLQRCQRNLVSGGLIVLKENVCRKGFIVDRDDSSITRSDIHMQKVFEQAGLKLVVTVDQTGFPVELFPIKMYALQ